MRYLFVVFVLFFFCGCNQPSAAPIATPDAVGASQSSPTPNPDISPLPQSPNQDATLLVPHDSPIRWPEEEAFELTPADKISISDWVGGRSGTDTSTLTVYGDGRVVVESERQGGAGGQESITEGQISPGETRAVFLRLRDSKLLAQSESGSGTTGSTLEVAYAGQTDRISVISRRPQAEAVFGTVRSAISTPSLSSPTDDPIEDKDVEEEEREPVPTSPYRGETKLVPHQSPIEWPQGELELSPADKVGVSDWIGGVAGTDSSSLTVYGDGKVVVQSGRSGRPGGVDQSAVGQLSPEETRAVFQRLRESTLLQQNESSGGTTGSTLTVEYGGKVDYISVIQRRSQAEALFAGARSVAKESKEK